MTKRTGTGVRENHAQGHAMRQYHRDVRIFICALVLFIMPFAVATAGVPSDPPPAQVRTAYLGEEILLQGVNTDSEVTYLCVTGPNLPPGGGRLDSPRSAVVDGDAPTFTRVDVGSDGHWEYRWRTAGIGIDAGTYTVYASSTPQGRNSLTGEPSGASTIVLLGPSGMVTTGISPGPGPSAPTVTGVMHTPASSSPEVPSTGPPTPQESGLLIPVAGIALAGGCLLLRRK